MSSKVKTPFALKVLAVASGLFLLGMFVIPFIPITSGDNMSKSLAFLLIMYLASLGYALKATTFKHFSPKDFDNHLTTKADEEYKNKNYKAFFLLSSITPLMVIGLATIVLLLIVLVTV